MFESQKKVGKTQSRPDRALQFVKLEQDLQSRRMGVSDFPIRKRIEKSSCCELSRVTTTTTMVVHTKYNK